MAHKLNQNVAKALHESNKRKLKPIAKDEGISFDDLEQEKVCEKCGKPLEQDLWKSWVCGYCGGWREEK